jgi:hypothetical protein
LSCAILSRSSIESVSLIVKVTRERMIDAMECCLPRAVTAVSLKCKSWLNHCEELFSAVLSITIPTVSSKSHVRWIAIVRQPCMPKHRPMSGRKAQEITIELVLHSPVPRIKVLGKWFPLGNRHCGLLRVRLDVKAAKSLLKRGFCHTWVRAAALLVPTLSGPFGNEAAQMLVAFQVSTNRLCRADCE